MFVREVAIEKASGGFGEYETKRDSSSEPMELSDWKSASDYDLQELIDGASLAAPAEDIRGRIRNAPSRVFAVWDGKTFVGYVGLDEVDA